MPDQEVEGSPWAYVDDADMLPQYVDFLPTNRHVNFGYSPRNASAIRVAEAAQIVATELGSQGARKSGARLLRPVLHGLTEVRENIASGSGSPSRHCALMILATSAERYAMGSSVLRRIARNGPPRRYSEIKIPSAHGDNVAHRVAP